MSTTPVMTVRARRARTSGWCKLAVGGGSNGPGLGSAPDSLIAASGVLRYSWRRLRLTAGCSLAASQPDDPQNEEPERSDRSDPSARRALRRLEEDRSAQQCAGE